MLPMQRLAPRTLRRRSRAPAAVLLFMLTAGATALALRQGIVPAAFNPLPALDLAQPQAWFIDWRLAALKHRPDLCQRVLVAPHIDAQPIADSPPKDGCGWTNGVRVSRAGGIRAGFDKLTCEAAAALALWLEHDVQPAATEILGQRVVSIHSIGGYSCRNIVGNPLWRDIRSEHATANAIDIGGFNLADGRHISVKRHWKSGGAEARFLKTAHQRACRYFHVVLGPDYNAAHHDHFHLDRGIYWRCK
jgi:hypothetical protein